ncbi:MAG: hypothetical protein JWN44_5696 [Myxococcales bacterium]|nr:hypothetical protein [Myxococcales bacterium]
MTRARLAGLVAASLTVTLSLAAFAQPPVRLAVLPPRDGSLGAAAGRIEAALVESAQALPGFVLANLAGTKLTGLKKGDAKLDPQPSGRALALGKETSSQRAVSVEATPLGEGLVIYLQAVEVPSGRVLGSTTISLAGGNTRAPHDRDTVRAALMRILDPGRYNGRLQIRLDVQGAEVQIDGRPSHSGLVELPVGTHALRVTHPAYHDFLRFLDVEFDKTLPVDINLAAYPLAEGEMTENQKRGLPSATRKPLKWYRTWWALSLAGVAVTGITVGVVWLVRPGLPGADSSTGYNPNPTP